MSPRRRLGRRARGFTLIELTVSLVAGLIVAMAVMGVSKEATNTFHEEVRVSAAEMGLRIAVERIRMDLARASYMGTGNILGDPLVATRSGPPPSGIPVPVSPTLSSYISATVPYSLNYLSGIALHPERASVINRLDTSLPADSNAKAQLQQAANQPPTALVPLAPDSIDIAGNFSTSDEYAVKVIRGVSPPGKCSTAFALSVEMTTPAGWRLRNAETAAGNTGQALQAAFHPGGSQASAFLLKFTDWTGKAQYLVECAGGPGVTTTYSPTGGGTIPLAMIYLSLNSTILTTADTGGSGGLAGYSAGIATVSPLEIMRWDIESQSQLAAQNALINTTLQADYTLYNATSTANIDASNFVLTRGYLDVSDSCGNGGPCNVDPYTVEVVSEYAMDLKFGVTVDSWVNGNCLAFPCPTAAPTYTTNPFLNFRMDTLGNGATNQYIAQTSAYAVNQGPQRIRDVQVRLGVRSAFGDRPLDLYPPASSALSNSYLFRYALDNTGGTNGHYNPGLSYARVRETTVEVALPNQARFYW